MRAADLPRAETALVTPRALRGYAEGLGWQKVDGVNGMIAAYHSPADRLRQLIVPLDPQLDDYSDRTAEAVVKLAEFEGRPVREVLEHLLLPPADVLTFRMIGADTETGDVPLERGLAAIDGARTGLLAAAHSVEKPQPYFTRLRREAAKAFLSRCRMTTGRGSFVLSVACPLDQQPAVLPGTAPEPFARRVTTLFMDTLAGLAAGTDRDDASELADPTRAPGMSANLCEALGLLRPAGERAEVVVSAVWSRSRMPTNRKAVQEVRLDQPVFDLAEQLAPLMRTRPEASADWFAGYVEELRGGPTSADPRPAGEVRFILFLDDRTVSARADLTAEEYARAGAAHLQNRMVLFFAELHRLPRVSRLDNLTDFQLLEPTDEARS